MKPSGPTSRVDDGLRQTWRRRTAQEAAHVHLLDHTIIVSQNSSASAEFFRHVFDVPEAPSWGPFVNVQLGDGTLI